MSDDAGRSYEERIREHRRHKDEFFAEHPQSPIPAAERADFDGLRYFDPDPDYRVEAELREHGDPEEIVLETTQDGERRYRNVGEFRVRLADGGVTLQAYRAPGHEDRLWVPLRDETNGDETYPAGRYLDLEDPDDRTKDGRWVLDFNEAYSPFCTYSGAYECPLVPMENRLDVAVRAGERTPEKWAGGLRGRCERVLDVAVQRSHPVAHGVGSRLERVERVDAALRLDREDGLGLAAGLLGVHVVGRRGHAVGLEQRALEDVHERVVLAGDLDSKFLVRLLENAEFHGRRFAEGAF